MKVRIFGFLSLIGFSPKVAPTKEIPWNQATSQEQEAEMARLHKVFLASSRCPDCQKGDFFGGPEGGCSMNVYCGHCGHWFNTLNTGSGMIFAERIRINDMPNMPTLLVRA